MTADSHREYVMTISQGTSRHELIVVRSSLFLGTNTLYLEVYSVAMYITS